MMQSQADVKIKGDTIGTSIYDKFSFQAWKTNSSYVIKRQVLSQNTNWQDLEILTGPISDLKVVTSVTKTDARVRFYDNGPNDYPPGIFTFQITSAPSPDFTADEISLLYNQIKSCALGFKHGLHEYFAVMPVMSGLPMVVCGDLPDSQKFWNSL